MTRSLPAKIGAIEGGMGHARPSVSSVCHLSFFDTDGRYFLNRRCPHQLADTDVFPVVAHLSTRTVTGGGKRQPEMRLCPQAMPSREAQ